MPVLAITVDISGLLGFSNDDFLAARVALKQQIHADDEDIATAL